MCPGPRGYGPKCMLHVQVAGQTTIVPIDFSFKAPTADYSEPRAYDAKGEDIVIHGQNFAHGYAHSAAETRKGKVTDALTHIGVSILGAFFTTAGSTLFLFPTWIYLFYQLKLQKIFIIKQNNQRTL